jgi:hypothetical protein
MGKPPPKRLRKRLICNLCQPRHEFDSSDTFERHLIADHDYDHCQICLIIGPSSLIRSHIVTSHSGEGKKVDKLCCYICCGSGPVFSEVTKLVGHLVTKHDLKSSTRYNF